MTHTYSVNIDSCDLDSLESDEDFDREAERLLPGVLEQLGRATGEVAWDTLQEGLKVPGFAPNRSPSAKSKFVNETAKNYVQKISPSDRARHKDVVVSRLKSEK